MLRPTGEHLIVGHCPSVLQGSLTKQLPATYGKPWERFDADKPKNILYVCAEITGIVRRFCILPSLPHSLNKTAVVHWSPGVGYISNTFLSLSSFFVFEVGICGGAGDGRDSVMNKHSYHIQGLQSFNLET